ncbi:MAG: FAD-dependent oxidoreductase [Myxococcota bacterium]
MIMRQVTILGGGLSGLMAAWKLQQQEGIRTLVLEREDQVGGLSKSLLWEGFRSDVGPEMLQTSDPLLRDELKVLMGGNYQVPYRQSSLWLERMWLRYPLTTRMLTRLPWGRLLQIGGGLLKDLWFRSRSDQEDWERRVIPQEEKLWPQFLASDRFSRLWRSSQPLRVLTAGERFLSNVNVKAKSSFLQRLQGMGKQVFRVPEAYGRSFHIPQEGMGSVAERLKREVTRLGGQVVTGARVRRLTVPEQEVREVWYEDGTSVRRVATDYVLSTIPLERLCSLLDPFPPQWVVEGVKQFRYRVLLQLHVLLNSTQEARTDWFYFPTTRYPFVRVHFMPRVKPMLRHLQHQPRTLGLRVDFLLEAMNPLVNMDGGELWSICAPLLAETGLLLQSEVLALMLHREHHAIPEVKSPDLLMEVRAYFKQLQRLRVFGMHSVGQAWSLEETLKQALYIARSVQEFL